MVENFYWSSGDTIFSSPDPIFKYIHIYISARVNLDIAKVQFLCCSCAKGTSAPHHDREDRAISLLDWVEPVRATLIIS